MYSFKLEKEEKFGDVNAKLYSYRGNNNEISGYIKSKIEQSTNNFSELLNSHAGNNIDKQSILNRFKQLSTPTKHKIPAFDVRRSIVTEFMAEFLLEREFQCIFFEQANKKINKSTINANRHSAGVDIVGIQENNSELKFIVAEVKASKQQDIPCTSARQLKQDIENILNFVNNRLIREIFSLSEELDKGTQQTKINKYINFLLTLIQQENSPQLFVEKLIIFPFLIRDNPQILAQKTLQDFHNFSELDTKGTETIGIIWAVNKDIDNFVQSIYSHD